MNSELGKYLNHNIDSFSDDLTNTINTSVDATINPGSFDDFGFKDEDKNEIKDEKTTITYNKSKNYFVKINEFLGFIVSVNADEKIFKTLFRDSCFVERELEFSFEDVQKEDWPKIKSGQEIIFIYGKQIDHGTEFNTSKIYFRKAKKWTTPELASKEQEAQALFEYFNNVDKK